MAAITSKNVVIMYAYGPVKTSKYHRGIAASVPTVPGIFGDSPAPKNVAQIDIHFDLFILAQSMSLKWRELKKKILGFFIKMADNESVHMTNQKKKSALEKIVDFLSVRDHSEKEIRNKLTQKEFESDEIEEGLELAQEQGLMLDPKVYAQNLSEQLSRKHKGILYINQYLASKGLPPVSVSWELELEKAKYLILNRFSKNPPYTIEEKQDIYRYLTNRGYADQTIDKLIHTLGTFEAVEKDNHEER